MTDLYLIHMDSCRNSGFATVRVNFLKKHHVFAKLFCSEVLWTKATICFRTAKRYAPKRPAECPLTIARQQKY